MRPFSTGSRPATALSSVDLPEPLVPMRPMASPRYATKETFFTAWTRRTPAAFSVFPRRRMRLRAAVAEPRPAPVPLTR